MGRFQVPWREINMPKLLEGNKQLSVVRRRSGGGTVYHDLGNWNFCFIHKQRDLPRRRNLEIMIALLKGVGLDVAANERYDLVFHHENGQTYKVSGSAFKQKKDTSLHHGTLLIDASLKELKGHLGLPIHWDFEGKGVHSVPSPVINLAEFSKELTFESWCSHISDCFHQKALVWTEESVALNSEINAESDYLQSWEWKWGETPVFKIKLPIREGEGLSLLLEFKKGLCETALLLENGVEKTIPMLHGARLGEPLPFSLSEYGDRPNKLLDSALGHFFF